MKKEQKSEALIASEKAEAEELRQKIIMATNTVPAKIRNEASYQTAVKFKEYALSARKIAESKQPTLDKLRNAWNLLHSYYS